MIKFGMSKQDYLFDLLSGKLRKGYLDENNKWNRNGRHNIWNGVIDEPFNVWKSQKGVELSQLKKDNKGINKIKVLN